MRGGDGSAMIRVVLIREAGTMAQFTLASFSQSRLLRSETDPEIRQGVCVALCDRWLQSFLDKPQASPEQRMQHLAATFDQAKAHQRRYGALRPVMGRERARQQVGEEVGLDYEAQTVVVRRFVGKSGILAKVAGDLKMPGAAATWSMRFERGGGHAIAGVNRIERVTINIATTHAHVFDPNVGEYAAPISALPVILTDLFQRVPLYDTTVEIHRTTAAQR